MNKIVEFIKRNRRVNAKLYAPNTVEGVDYRICPALNLVVEFQGSGWHPNPFTLSNDAWDEWMNPIRTLNAYEKQAYDYNKAKVIYDVHGYYTFFVYYDTADNDLQFVEDYINDR